MKRLWSVMRWILIPVLAILLFGCFEIMKIEQPATARPGEGIEVYMEVKTEGIDENPHHGILGLLLPNDWDVEKVTLKGDYRGKMAFLPPGTPDEDQGGKVDYWTKSLERIFDSGDDMKWVVYQSTKGYEGEREVAFVDVYIDLMVGKSEGTYELGYFVTNAALDFTDPEYYDISRGHEIVVAN